MVGAEDAISEGSATGVEDGETDALGAQAASRSSAPTKINDLECGCANALPSLVLQERCEVQLEQIADPLEGSIRGRVPIICVGMRVVPLVHVHREDSVVHALDPGEDFGLVVEDHIPIGRDRLLDLGQVRLLVDE